MGVPEVWRADAAAWGDAAAAVAGGAAEPASERRAGTAIGVGDLGDVRLACGERCVSGR